MATKSKTPTNVVRVGQLANAFQLVARANHYMIGIVVEYSNDEMDDAEQILIERQNKLRSTKGKAWHELERALNLIDDERQKRVRVTSQAAAFHGDAPPQSREV